MKKILISEIFLSESYNNLHYISGDHVMIIKFYELMKDTFDISIRVSLRAFLDYAKYIDADTKLIDRSNLEEYIKSIENYDIFITNNSVFSIYHPNKVYWVHSNYFDHFTKEELNAFLEEVKKDYVKAVVFVSEPLKNIFSPYVPKNKMFVIPNFIEYICKTPKTYQEPFKVVWVGRLEPNKNWLELLKVVKKEDIDTYFIGDGFELRFALEMKATKPRAFKNIHFLGHLPYQKLLDFHKEHTSLLVFTSKDEGFGLVLLEAMAFGIPCIATSNSITRYVLGEDGLFYRTEKELKSLILKMKQDKEFYNEYALYCLNRAKLFYKDVIKQHWEELLGTLA